MTSGHLRVRFKMSQSDKEVVRTMIAILMTLLMTSDHQGVSAMECPDPVDALQTNQTYRNVTLIAPNLVAVTCLSSTDMTTDTVRWESSEQVQLSKCVDGAWTDIRDNCIIMGMSAYADCSDLILPEIRGATVGNPPLLSHQASSPIEQAKVYKCDEGEIFISGDTVKVTSCKQDMWQPDSFSDVCIQDCTELIPRDCTDVIRNFNESGHYFTSPSGQHDGYLNILCENFDSEAAWTLVSRVHLDYTDSYEDETEPFTTGYGNVSEGNNYFIGMTNLMHLAHHVFGAPRPLVFLIIIEDKPEDGSNYNITATYSNITINGSRLILDGVFYGDGGDCWGNKESIDLHPDSDDSIYCSPIKTEAKWSPFQSVQGVWIYARPQDYDETVSCPVLPINQADPGNTTMLSLAYKREEGDQIEYSCFELFYEQSNNYSSGPVVCNRTEDGTMEWNATLNLPCLLQCPPPFEKSVLETHCILFDMDEQPHGLHSAALTCRDYNSSLATLTSTNDLSDIPEDSGYFYTAHFANSDSPTTLRMDPTGWGLSCSDNETCEVMHPNSCLTVTRDSYKISPCNDTTTRAMCKLPVVCPHGYTHYRGLCYKVNCDDGDTVLEEQLAQCKPDGSALAYPETHDVSEFLQKLAFTVNGEAKKLSIGMNDYPNLGNFTNQGMYNLDPAITDVLPMTDGVKFNNWRKLMLTDMSYTRRQLPSSIQACTACQYLANPDCWSPPPNTTQGGTNNWNGVTLDLGTEVNYTCYPGHFFNGNMSLSEITVKCIGQLGNWYYDAPLPDCFAIEVCLEDLPTAPHRDALIAQVNESRYLNGSVSYTCPEGMTTAMGVSVQNITCQGAGDMYSFQPSTLEPCYPRCFDEAMVENATTNWNSSALYIAGDVIQATCIPGHEVRPGNTSSEVNCSSDGSWIGTPCYLACVDPPPQPESNMDPSTNGDNYVGTILTYNCQARFYIDPMMSSSGITNSSQVECNATGSWVPKGPLSCITLCLGDPPSGVSPLISSYDGTSINEGTEYVLSCEENYILGDMTESATVTCQADGTWSELSDLQTSCVIGTLHQPYVPLDELNTELVGPHGPYLDGSEMEVTCEGDMMSQFGETTYTLSFSESGWSEVGTEFHCYNVTEDEPEPVITEGNVGTSTCFEPPFYVGIECNYTCPGESMTRKLESTTIITFTPDGWSDLPQDFICLNATYMPPAIPSYAIPGGSLVNATAPFFIGMSVYYGCFSGYQSTKRDSEGNIVPYTSLEYLGDEKWSEFDPEFLCILQQDPDAPPPPTTEPPPSYPDANVFEQAYDITTDVHMPSIEQFMVNADEDAPDFNLCTGPFGFGYAVSIKEEDSQCLKRSPYAVPGDCTQDPSTCTKGFSFSIWVRTNISMSVFYTAHKLHEDPKKYILSTGGDEFGHPGVAVYVQGLALVALVSTGDKYWKLQVLGPLVNDDWNNLGLRFVGTEDEQGGVELYLNANKIGHEHHSKPSAPRLDHFDPSEMLIGCHRDTDDMNYRGFITADFDEFASWNRRLPDDQVIFFMGGFEGEIENLSPEEFDVMIGKTDLSDPAQAEIGLAMLNAMADNLPGPDSGSSDTSNDTSTDQNENDGNGTVVLDEGALKLRGMADVIAKMTNPRLVKKDITLEEFDIFMKVVEIASKLLNESHADRWKLIAKDGHRSSRGVKEDIEHYVDALAKNMKMAPTNPEPEKFIKTTDNIVVKIDKMTITDYESLGEHYSAPNYRESDAMRKLWTEWDQPSDKVFVPTGIFSDPRCKDKPVSVVTFLYDSYDEVGPQNIAEEGMRHDVKNEIDSRVMRVNVVPDAPSVPRTSNSYHECRIDQRKMEKSWPSAKFENKLKVKTHRGLQFHQDENNSPIYRRICVWWNQLLGEIGAWDSDGCDPLAGNAYFSKCRCRYFGTYAVIAEHLEHRELPEEPEWSKTIKIIFHIISAICIIIYILFVAFAGDLKDQFHMSGAAFAACVLGGSIALLISDSHQIREDRHSCAAIGSLIHGFYLLASAWLANISHAGFKGVTRGIITGKMKAYIMLSFGITLMSLGTSYLFYIHDLGNDPRCFISWYDDVKMLFLFFPLMIFVLVAIFYAFVIFFNLRHAKKTSKVILTEYSSFILGSTFLTIYFTIVWILGAAAYIKIGKKDSGVLPYFQILNSLVGVVILLCLGLHSTKFRGVLSQTAQKKREQLQKYKENANQKGKKLKDPEGKKKKPSASKNPPPPPTNTGLDPPPAAQYIPPPEPPAAPPADLPSPPDVPSPPLDVGALSL